MRLHAKQKIFSLRSAYNIYDDSGKERYSVKGELLSLVHKLHVFSSDGKEVATVQRQLFTLMPTFNIYINGEHAARIVKRFTLLKPSYVLQKCGWKVDGDFLSHNYRIYCDRGEKVASISKKWFSIGDCFELDVNEPEDEIMALCVMLVIDYIMDSQNSSASAAAQSND